MRTRYNSGMFPGGQFSVLNFAFFVEFTIWPISAFSNFMGLGQRLDSKGAHYMEMFRRSKLHIHIVYKVLKEKQSVKRI
jgi:hypothetical protein